MSRTIYTLPRGWYTSTRTPLARRTHQPLSRNNYIDYLRNENQMSRVNPVQTPQQKAIMCLVIAAHNEELVLEQTLRSAMHAGMKAEHIYVVDDNSTDATSRIARSVLPRENVMTLRSHNGKGVALSKAAKKFSLTTEYRWVHIADADGAFAPNYFIEFRKNLRVEFAAATGYIRSLPGMRISEYRAYEYTVGMELHRRIQSLLGVISIIPGPTSCFRSDVFDQLNFASHALTEDFDVTLQIYRKKLGKIQFIPEAIAYTQDPPTTKAFVQQITRWNRGVMQGMTRHGIGKKLAPIDAYLSYQLAQGLLLCANIFVWVPYMVATKGGAGFLAVTFLMDVLLTFVIALMAAMRNKRWDMLSAFPIIYALKWVSLGVFIKSFVEVMILRKFRITSGAWANDNTRRYKFAAS